MNSKFHSGMDILFSPPPRPNQLWSSINVVADVYRHLFPRRRSCKDIQLTTHNFVPRLSLWELYLHTPIRYCRRQMCSRQLCDVLSRDHAYDSVLTALIAPQLCTAVYGNKLKYCIIRNLCGQTPERHLRVALYRGSSLHAH